MPGIDRMAGDALTGKAEPGVRTSLTEMIARSGLSLDKEEYNNAFWVGDLLGNSAKALGSKAEWTYPQSRSKSGEIHDRKEGNG